MTDSTNYNALQDESSPYLLQHATNPVEWHPWGEEAFKKAKEEDKPVFVSIGYATCHWCHVMAHESFEDEQIAGLMNDAFVNIKVDREERPDIDNTYMLVCQMLNGRGGWPLNVWLTPDKKPFYAATYIPKNERHGQPGMQQIIPWLSNLWNEERAKVTQSSHKITDAFQQSTQLASGDTLEAGFLNKVYTEYANRYDEQFGGFGSSPKFPSPQNLILLLRYANHHPETNALPMVQKTLTNMRLGGLFDQIGFGFHRYSTDEQWLVPHFEKMLYDQAMMLVAYTEGWQMTQNELFKQTADEITNYLTRIMRDENGGFYSAEDADSEGEEGKYYVWSTQEVRDILSNEEAKRFINLYNLTDEGNYQDESTGQRTGQNIPHLSQPVASIADSMNMESQHLTAELAAIRKKLFAARQNRVQPLLDDKILTNWNGLLIAALAKAGRTFNDKTYTDLAGRCYQFIKRHLTDKDDHLQHRWRKNNAAIDAFAEDYSFLIWGLLELYRATFKTDYLTDAVQLNNTFINHFWDEADGGFFTTAKQGEKFLGRKKEFHDGALPSANSVAMLNLLRLGRITGNTDWETMADTMNSLYSPQIKKAPTGFGFALQSIQFVSHAREIIIVGPRQHEDTRAMLQVINEHFLPNAVVILKDPDDESIEEIVPYLSQFSMIDQKATAYVCENYSCNQPVNEVNELIDML